MILNVIQYTSKWLSESLCNSEYYSPTTASTFSLYIFKRYSSQNYWLWAKNKNHPTSYNDGYLAQLKIYC